MGRNPGLAVECALLEEKHDLFLQFDVNAEAAFTLHNKGDKGITIKGYTPQ